MNRDSIRILGLRVACHIGVSDEERSSLQDVLVDVEAELDLGKAATSDDLRATLDYGTVTDAVAGVVRATRSKLLEHLAGEIAATVLGYREVLAVTVTVGKASPPVDQDVASIGVRIRRERE